MELPAHPYTPEEIEAYVEDRVHVHSAGRFADEIDAKTWLMAEIECLPGLLQVFLMDGDSEVFMCGGQRMGMLQQGDVACYIANSFYFNTAYGCDELSPALPHEIGHHMSESLGGGQKFSIKKCWRTAMKGDTSRLARMPNAMAARVTDMYEGAIDIRRHLQHAVYSQASRRRMAFPEEMFAEMTAHYGIMRGYMEEDELFARMEKAYPATTGMFRDAVLPMAKANAAARHRYFRKNAEILGKSMFRVCKEAGESVTEDYCVRLARVEAMRSQADATLASFVLQKAGSSSLSPQQAKAYVRHMNTPRPLQSLLHEHLKDAER